MKKNREMRRHADQEIYMGWVPQRLCCVRRDVYVRKEGEERGKEEERREREKEREREEGKSMGKRALRYSDVRRVLNCSDHHLRSSFRRVIMAATFSATESIIFLMQGSHTSKIKSMCVPSHYITSHHIRINVHMTYRDGMLTAL